MTSDDAVLNEIRADVVVDTQPGDVLLVENQDKVAVQERDCPLVITRDDDTQVVVSPAEVVQVVVAAGSQGVPGPQGPPGAPGGAGAQFLTRTAGVSISALRVVYDLGGEVFPLSYDDAGHVFAVLGVAVTSGQKGADISVQLEGTVTDSAWNWTYARVYLGLDGQLTQTPPPDGFSVLIGFAATPTSINLSISDPIEV